MARWLACVLMVLLPLQSLWGVASRYCAHEVPAVQAAHLGHHAHQPHAPQGFAGEGQSGAFAGAGLGTEAGSGVGAEKALKALKAAANLASPSLPHSLAPLSSAAPLASDASPAEQAYQLDADCHDCHGLPSLGLPAWEKASGLVLPRHPRPLSPALAWRSAPSALPERPQWG